MNNPRLICILSTLLLLAGCKPEQASSGSTNNENESSVAVEATHPFVQGELLAVTQQKGAYLQALINSYVDSYGALLPMIQETLPPESGINLEKTLSELPSFLGFTELGDVEFQSIKTGERAFVGIRKIDLTPSASGLLWNLQGEPFGVQETLTTLPAETVIYARGTLNPESIVKLVEFGFNAAGQDIALAKNFLRTGGERVGLDIESLLGTLKGGASFGITMDDSTYWRFPLGDQILRIPETGVFVTLQTSDDQLFQTVLKMIGMVLPIKPVAAERNGHPCFFFPLPMLPVQSVVAFQIAQVDDQLVVCSSPKVFEQLLKGEVESTLADALFLDKHLPEKSHSIMVFSPAFGKHLQDATGPLIAPLDNGAWVKVLEETIATLPSEYLATGHREGDRVIFVSTADYPFNSSIAPNPVTAVALTSVLAAIAVPNFVKARESAMQNACINNLRMIESAKDQYAIENGLSTGEAVTKEQISAYIRGGFPDCPAGGTYTIGVIGDEATCTIDGHVLP